MVNDKHKFIFVHVPKTGGTSITKFFEDSGLQDNSKYKKLYKNRYTYHTPLRYLSHPKTKDYFKFIFVRNPWDRYVSEYIWRLHNTSEIRISCPFGDFVRQTINVRGMIKADIHFLPQYEYAYDKTWNLSVDFIGQYENLEQDFKRVCERIGLEHRELPVTNKFDRKKYEEYYTEETKQLVAERYAKDIEVFGYVFGK